MLPLIPLLIQLAPTIGDWLFGPKAAPVVKAAGNIVTAVTGVTDPHSASGAAQVAAVLEGKPELALQLQAQLAQLSAAQMQAQFADVANARQQTVSLAAAGSLVAWSAPAISLVVLVTFGVTMWAALTHSLPPGNEATLNLLLGSLSSMATGVVAYWVGSSAGSRAKDQTIAAASAALATSTPGPQS